MPASHLSPPVPNPAVPAATERRHWDDVAVRWTKWRTQSLWRTHADAVNAALLARWLPPEPVETVLKTDLFDEAVSDGLYPLLADRARTVLGLDVARDIVAAATRRYPMLGGVEADVRRLPFADSSLDAIASLSTLDHFPDAREIDVSLAELHRVLRPGGTLILTLDNIANPLVGLRNLLPFRVVNGTGLVPYYVGKSHGPRGLVRAAERAGFAVRECDATVHCPRVLAVKLCWVIERVLGGRGAGAFLRALMAFERLRVLPSRFRTGHFVAIRATKPVAGG